MEKKQEKRKKEIKALVLISNGLDSRLALKIIKQQCYVEAIFFVLPFIQNKEKVMREVKKFCKTERVKLKVVRCDKGNLLQEYLKIVKNPRYGRGKACNPCIDCRIFILKLAREHAEKIGAEIIVTGEVLGERPMSQNKKALKIVEKESGLKNFLLRPLSAKLLEPTTAEKQGKIRRDFFYDIQGRTRKKQIELAKKYKINYPSPAGGCLLCEKTYCEKLKPFLNKKISEFEIELTKLGRHFENSNIIIGRNEKENEILKKLFLKHKKGILIIPKQPGGTAWVKNRRFVGRGKELIKKYSKHKILQFKIKSFT